MNNILGFNAPLVPNANYANTQFLAGFERPNATTSYTEESNNAVAATFNGSAQISTADKFFGNSSLRTGITSSDYLSFGDQPQFDFVNATTMRFKFKRVGAGGSSRENLAGKWNTSTDNQGWIFSINEAGIVNANIFLYLSDTGPSGSNLGLAGNVSGAQNDGNWHEYAVTHNGSGLWEIFFDGIKVATNTLMIPFSNSASFRIGNYEGGSTSTRANGYFDEFRIQSGVEFTANYTPQSQRFPRY